VTQTRRDIHLSNWRRIDPLTRLIRLEAMLDRSPRALITTPQRTHSRDMAVPERTSNDWDLANLIRR
jgi:hypothetical protein